MSFRYISLPLWILICVLLSIYLIYTGITRRKVERKGLIVIYFTTASIGLLAALYRVFNELLISYKQYTEYILYVIIGMLIITFLQLIYCVSLIKEMNIQRD
jgi:hypothetical protein